MRRRRAALIYSVSFRSAAIALLAVSVSFAIANAAPLLQVTPFGEASSTKTLPVEFNAAHKRIGYAA